MHTCTFKMRLSLNNLVVEYWNKKNTLFIQKFGGAQYLGKDVYYHNKKKHYIRSHQWYNKQFGILQEDQWINRPTILKRHPWSIIEYGFILGNQWVDGSTDKHCGDKMEYLSIPKIWNLTKSFFFSRIFQFNCSYMFLFDVVAIACH